MKKVLLKGNYLFSLLKMRSFLRADFRDAKKMQCVDYQ